MRTISNLERAVTRPQGATVRALATGLALGDEDRAVFERTARRSAGERRRPRWAGLLPAPMTSIVGREVESAAVARLLLAEPGRLVTITGPGGVGKSRLALDVAWRVAGGFERADAIDVSPLRDRDEVLAAIGSAWGVRGSAATIAARVAAATWLLLVDGLEHVPDAVEDLGALLDRCPGLRILATSRLRAGRSWRLAPLPLPSSGEADTVAANPAVTLFAQRARARRPDFRVTSDNAAAVESVCRRMDGLPLAIELAAGQIGERDIDEIEKELATRSGSVRADLVDIPGRHRTLRATVEWSTDRLAAADRIRFAALGAFRGVITYAGWEVVLAGGELPVDDLRATLARLEEASLVATTDASAIVMPDTIREIAEDLLVESGLDRPLRVAHARHMLDLVRTADADAIESHVDNIRGAVAFGIAHEPGLFDADVVTALGTHMRTRGRLSEAHRTLEAVAGATENHAARMVALLQAGTAANIRADCQAALRLVAPVLADPDHRIGALNLVGSVHKQLGDLDAALRAYEECLAAATEADHQRYVTVALNNLATVAHERGAYMKALGHYEHSLRIRKERGEPAGIAAAHANIGALYKDLGEHDPAYRHLVLAVELQRDVGDPYAIAFALSQLAVAELGLGRIDDGERTAAQALAIGVEIDNPVIRSLAATALGDAARLRGADAAAREQYLAAMADTPPPFERGRVLERLAAVATDEDEASTLLAEAEAIRRERQLPIPPLDRELARVNRQAGGQ